MRVLSIDLGDVRTGVAISDLGNTLATPLCVIVERNKDELLKKVANLIDENHITHVVIGLPKNMDGTEGGRARLAREFKEKLNFLVNVKIDMLDERWSTKSAQNYLNCGTTKKRKKKTMIDKIAATVILQQYLDSIKID